MLFVVTVLSIPLGDITTKNFSSRNALVLYNFSRNRSRQSDAKSRASFQKNLRTTIRVGAFLLDTGGNVHTVDTAQDVQMIWNDLCSRVRPTFHVFGDKGCHSKQILEETLSHSVSKEG